MAFFIAQIVQLNPEISFGSLYYSINAAKGYGR
jgi:hypothetical protein